MGKYFNVTLKPTITASRQHSSAFAAGDILFDWAPIQVPKGSSRLLSTTAIIRGTNATDQAAVDMELFFAKSIDGTAPSSLGVLNSAVTAASAAASEKTGWFRNVIGRQFFDADANGMGSSDDLVFINTIQAPGNAGGGSLVLSGEPNSGDNVGFDTIYVAGVAQGDLNFSTTVLARGGITADGTSVVPTDAGSDDDPNADLVFQPGDIIHTATDQLLGTIKSISAFDTNHQDIILTSGFDVDVANNAELYNISPIRFEFSFEK